MQTVMSRFHRRDVGQIVDLLLQRVGDRRVRCAGGGTAEAGDGLGVGGQCRRAITFGELDVTAQFFEQHRVGAGFAVEQLEGVGRLALLPEHAGKTQLDQRLQRGVIGMGTGPFEAAASVVELGFLDRGLRQLQRTGDRVRGGLEFGDQTIAHLAGLVVLLRGDRFLQLLEQLRGFGAVVVLFAVVVLPAEDRGEAEAEADGQRQPVFLPPAAQVFDLGFVVVMGAHVSFSLGGEKAASSGCSDDERKLRDSERESAAEFRSHIRSGAREGVAFAAQGFYLNGVGRRLVVADHQRVTGTGVVGALQLRLQTAAAGIEHQPQIRELVAQRFRQLQRLSLGRCSHPADVDLRRIRGDRDLLHAHQQDQPLDAETEADAGGLRAAKLLDQTVVTAASADRALRAELVGDPLEHRVRVVIEPTDQPRIDHVGNAQRIEPGLHRVEMGQRGFVEIVEQARRAFDDGLRRRHLGIEHPQRIAVQAALGVVVEPGFVLFEIGDQRGAVIGAAAGGAQGIDLQLETAESQPLPELGGDGDHFDIDVGRRNAEGFDVELMELPIAAGLRALVAEHRAGAPDALLLVEQDAVLDAGANHASGQLRAQRQRFAAAILEGIHLLFDDIGHFADRALEQLGALDHRQPQFAVAVSGKHLRGDGMDVLPGRGIGRQDIVHAANGLDLHEAELCEGRDRRGAGRRGYWGAIGARQRTAG
eukprot:TRINITY_DN2336_c0_g1_i3.p1 TRINITY_DN2336_c0_g1~~TRINITY_DN2336_c0_g1_i3.p1  ORF type:complete len:704 (-),score=109.00 TRINITY_DN2336_c0_g1_i3:16-2127(-)